MSAQSFISSAKKYGRKHCRKAARHGHYGQLQPNENSIHGEEQQSEPSQKLNMCAARNPGVLGTGLRKAKLNYPIGALPQPAEIQPAEGRADGHSRCGASAPTNRGN